MRGSIIPANILYGRTKPRNRKLTIFQQSVLDANKLEIDPYFYMPSGNQYLFGGSRWLVKSPQAIPNDWLHDKKQKNGTASTDIFARIETFLEGNNTRSLSKTPFSFAKQVKDFHCGNVTIMKNDTKLDFPFIPLFAIEKFADEGQWHLLNNPQRLNIKHWEILIHEDALGSVNGLVAIRS